MKGYLRVRQISESHSIPERTIRRWIATGKLPITHVIGSRIVLISADDVAALVNKSPSPTPAAELTEK